MSDILSHLPPSDLVPSGRHGRQDGPAGVTAYVVERLALATVTARKGGTGAVIAAAETAFGIPLVDGPKVSLAAEAAFMGTAPGRWLVSAPGSAEALESRLAAAFGGLAALTDQSDANLVLDLYGPRIHEVLAKLVPLDLHPSVFTTGDVAATLVSLIPLTFWQLNDTPAYRFAVPRSFAPAFLRALVAAGAEGGIDITGTERG